MLSFSISYSNLIKLPCFADTTEWGDWGGGSRGNRGETEGHFTENSNILAMHRHTCIFFSCSWNWGGERWMTIHRWIFFGFTQLLFFVRFCVSNLVWGYFKLLSDLMLTGSFGRAASPGVPGWDILGVSHGPSIHPLIVLVGLYM
jgi:hypothetical protein